MANTKDQLVTVGKVNPRRRKFFFIGNTVTILLIVTIGVFFLIRHFVTRQNQVSNNELDSFETETSAQTTFEASIPTTVSTAIPETIYKSYVRTNQIDIQPNKSFSLDSTLIYNSEDVIEYHGYIATIQLTLYQLFNPITTSDYQIHFLTILDNNILSHMTLQPSFDSLFHSFEISPWKLVVRPGSFLCIGVDNGQLPSVENSDTYGNKISATHTGKAYSSTNFYSPYENIQRKWNRELAGIALSFTIAHNPTWNGTIPSTTTPMSTTRSPYYNRSYGSLDDVQNIGIQLNAFAYFNWADECKERGSIISIRIKFCTPFQKENTDDGFLWFFVTHYNGEVKFKYPVIPKDISLVQVFEIPPGVMLIYTGQYLSVSTMSNNSKGNNTICLRDIGYAYSFHLNDIQTNNGSNPEWLGEEYGIALSYHTTNEGVPDGAPEGADIG